MWVDFGGDSFVVLAIATGIVVYLIGYRWQHSRRPGPSKWPIIGNTLEVSANVSRIHDWCYEYMKRSPSGTLVINTNAGRSVLIASPDNVEHILKTNFPNYIKGPRVKQRVAELLGSGIFSSDGDIWRQQRKTASFEFSHGKIRDTSTNVYREHALRLMVLLDTITSREKAVDIQDLLLRMTMDSICKIAFGMDQKNLTEDLPDVEFARAFDTLAVLSQARNFDVFWKLKKRWNIGREGKVPALTWLIDSFTYGVIQERRKELANLHAQGKDLDRHDLLSRFMGAKSTEGEPLSDQALRDAILSFVIAGRDTTASTLSWFLYLLCLHPEVAEKCYQEMNEVFGEKEADEKNLGADRFLQFGSLLTYESLGKLQYLQATLSETLRLFPPVARNSKFAVEDDVLPDGTLVKKGDNVVYLSYVMGRMEFIWGPDALQYRPERWLKEGRYQPESPFKFAAFQAGPRICLGKDTAYVQMKMTAAMLLRHFRFQMVPDQNVTYVVSLVMTIKNGLKLTLEPR